MTTRCGIRSCENRVEISPDEKSYSEVVFCDEHKDETFIDECPRCGQKIYMDASCKYIVDNLRGNHEGSTILLCDECWKQFDYLHFLYKNSHMISKQDAEEMIVNELVEDFKFPIYTKPIGEKYYFLYENEFEFNKDFVFRLDKSLINELDNLLYINIYFSAIDDEYYWENIRKFVISMHTKFNAAYIDTDLNLDTWSHYKSIIKSKIRKEQYTKFHYDSKEIQTEINKFFENKMKQKEENKIGSIISKRPKRPYKSKRKQNPPIPSATSSKIFDAISEYGFSDDIIDDIKDKLIR